MASRLAHQLGESDLLRAIDFVYQAATEPERWPDLLSRLNDLTRSEASTLLVQDVSSQQGSSVWQAGVDPALAGEYAEWAPRNIYLLRGDPLLQTGVVLHGEAAVSDREVLASDYFDGYLRRAGFLHNLGACIVRERGTLAILILLRRLGVPSHSEEQKRFVEALMPHLQRAVAVQQRLEGLELHRATAELALDRLAIGALFLDARGRVAFHNRAAHEILRAGDGLKLGARGELVVQRAAEAASLQRLLGEACATGVGRGAKPGGAMRISRPSGKRPLALLVAPLRAETIPLIGRSTYALLFVSDPDRSASGIERVLQDLYELTPAEADLAADLLSGARVEEIATRRGISVNTARTHVKRILDKSGARGQADLLRMLAAGAASLRRDDPKAPG